MIKELTSSEAQNFISKHENENPSSLALKHAGHQAMPIQLLASQIKSRQKAKNKLPEWYKKKGVLFPHGVSMEQCSSEKTAKYKARLISGSSLADLTGGTGVDTFYLSKNFNQTTYVEQKIELCELAQHNFEILGSGIKAVNMTSESYLETNTARHDWYYIDPARRDDANKKVFRIEDCQPDLNTILPIILKQESNVLVKFSPMLDIKEALNTVKYISKVHIVSLNNECKEVLLLLRNNLQGSPEINAVNMKRRNTEAFSFTYEQEASAPVKFSEPLQFLYEPNASILKAGGFKSVATAFDVIKLSSNSHLYTSDVQQKAFPGRTFRIIDVVTVAYRELKQHLENGKANLATRNFPLSTDHLKKKLKIKDGGSKYIFATTLKNGKHKLLICEKPALD